MKNTFLLLLTSLLFSTLLTTPAQATIIRVNNIPGSNAPYSSAQTAHNDANAGDTLYIEPSPTSYNSLTMTKPLTIIGNGYFLEDNINLQENTNTSKFSVIDFNAGSENSKISGLSITQRVRFAADSITMERCYINTSLSPNQSYGCQFFGDVDHIYLYQNYIYSYTQSINGAASFIYMQNNFFTYIVSFGADDTDLYLINNILTSTLIMSSALVQNNIQVSGSVTLNSCIIQNNLCNGIQFPAGDGNQQNVNMNNVFVYGTSPDGKYQLKPNSPAKGAGFYGGEDCGVYDVPPGFGYVPYKLSGIPSIPSIYNLDAEIDGNTLNVTISTRSNN